MAPLPRSTPEKQGVASTALITFLQEINKDIRHLHSFMFLRHGSVISEGWWNPWQTDTRHMLFSLSKSFTSTAVGIAISEGRFQLTDRLVDLFPDKLPGMVSQNLADMQVKHLLSMSTGQNEDTTPFIVFEEDPVRAFLARPVDYKPGTHFFYNSGATFILSHIITKFTGLKLIEYLEPRILQPLGIENAEWESHPDGIDFGGWGLSIKTEDIALFGQLYLQKGRWNGQQLIPEAWVQQASSFQADNAPDENPDWAQGYGFQFWLCSPPGVYRGDGAFGQYCIIMPEQDAVIAITGGLQNMQSVLTKIWKHILPAMKPGVLPDQPKQHENLQQNLSKLSIPPLPFNLSSDKEAIFESRPYFFEENVFFLKSVQLNFQNNQVKYQINFPGSDTQDHKLNFGRCSWVIDQSILANKTTYQAAACGSWITENVFQLCICHLEMPYMTNLFFTFSGEKVTLQFKYNVSFGPLESEPFSSI